MRRLLGALLLIAGAFFLFCFAAAGAHQARESTFSIAHPWTALGRGYPADALFLIGFLWAFGLGLRLSMAGAPPPVAPGAVRPAAMGPFARLAVINALLILTALFGAYIGGRANQTPSAIAVFGIVAMLQILAGVGLWLFAVRERPRSIKGLVGGSVLYALGVVVAVVVLAGGN